MKHGVIALALTGWLAVATYATETGIPASVGMPEGGLVALSSNELAGIEGGDLLLSVDRDQQMMVVTRINPGNYDNIQCYAVKVTTAVVKNKDVSPDLAKGAMENPKAALSSGGKTVAATQFPTGPAKIDPIFLVKDRRFEGPVIRTNATQPVAVLQAGSKTGETQMDAGYNIHYVDPAKASNTQGCIGVQSMAGMVKVVESLKADLKSYTDPSQIKQSVTVSSYTNNTPPPAATFKATEVKAAPVVVSKPSTPAPAPAPKPTTSKPWYQFW